MVQYIHCLDNKNCPKDLKISSGNKNSSLKGSFKKVPNSVALTMTVRDNYFKPVGLNERVYCITFVSKLF